jgi:hypothetical protein
MNRRWIIFVPVALLALWSTVAKADGLGDWTASQSCATGSVNVVEDSIVITGPDGGGCQGANWVQVETTIPEDVDTVEFTWSYWTNDGWVYDPPQYGINGVYTLLTQSNQASGSLVVEVTAGDIFTFRQYSTDSCCQPGHLTISDLSLWESTTTSTTPTTTIVTTTVPEQTVPATSTTTTTVPETTTTSTSTTTTSTTTTTSSTTTTTTTSSTLPAPVETYAPVAPPETTTSTTTTTVEETTTTVTLPPETTTTTVPATTTTQVATTTTEAPVETTTTVEPNLEPNLERLEDEVEIPAEEAVALATSPQVLSVVTPQQAVTIFESIDVSAISDTEKDAIVEAVQSAPLEVRQAFEETIDIFSDDFGDYVPIGSVVPVDTRRTLIAVAAGATAIAVSSRKP